VWARFAESFDFGLKRQESVKNTLVAFKVTSEGSEYKPIWAILVLFATQLPRSFFDAVAKVAERVFVALFLFLLFTLKSLQLLTELLDFVLH
jgi:hypothetical protein